MSFFRFLSLLWGMIAPLLFIFRGSQIRFKGDLLD
jgi:hypothetical protein